MKKRKIICLKNNKEILLSNHNYRQMDRDDLQNTFFSTPLINGLIGTITNIKETDEIIELLSFTKKSTKKEIK